MKTNSATNTTRFAITLLFFVIITATLTDCRKMPTAVLQTYTIGQGTVATDPDRPEHAIGTEVVVTATANPGWRFEYWEGNISGSQNPAQTTLIADASVFAIFVAETEEGLNATHLDDIERIGAGLGWTFDVGLSDATAYPLWALTGLVEPADKSQVGDLYRPIVAKQNQPPKFDWRDQAALTPVKSQRSCGKTGSCWAFATLGVVEASILIADRVEEDLAEQWLIDCNTYGYSCDNGGWWSFAHLVDRADKCGEIGARLEVDDPYQASDGVCDCPATFRYSLDSWSYVDPANSIPSTDKIKQAIMDYGPVAAGVAATTPFQAYIRGVFNAYTEARVNHAIVIVGWDDSLGTNGAWIMRNSWSTSWGEQGYMHIEYGCSKIGYGAAYIVYDPTIPVLPVAAFTGSPLSGETPLSVSFTDQSTPGSSPITSWSWSFGDGGTSTAQSPSHQYTNPGAYTISLFVTTAVGSDIETKTNYITVSSATVAPTAGFTASPTGGNAPLTVQFTDASSAGTSAITSWSWSFGDGGTSTAQSPSHQYTNPGAYTISLFVTTAVGSDIETKTNYITVSSATVAVPNVIGMEQSVAETALTGAGLAVGTIMRQFSTTVPAGQVISQSPAAGTNVAQSTPINLIVSLGAGETILLPGDVPLEMVWIPAGSFMMGRYAGEQDSYAREDPQHSVTLSSGFWMGKYEVTQAQWQAIMGTNPSSFPGASWPVETVSWNTIQSFITALNTATGRTFRLPSEAEWEYACRAGTTTRFYWGDDSSYTQIGSYAWYNVNGGSQTQEVGGKSPNAWGLYDMSGNVWEWCQDWYHDNYTGAPADGSAWESPTSSYRVLCGGAVSYYDGCCRSASRYDIGSPDYAYYFFGFRLARTP